MKKYLILLLVMIGWANIMSAQEDLKTSYIQGSIESIADGKYTRYASSQEFLNEYVTPVSQPSYRADYNLKIYDKLLYHFGYIGRSEIISFVSNKQDDEPMSKFQLIVDEDGKIIDCAMLASTDTDKDKKVLECLKNENYYNTAPTLNGKPCKSLILLSFQYHKSGKIDVTRDGYPLVPLTDSEASATSTDTSSNN